MADEVDNLCSSEVPEKRWDGDPHLFPPRILAIKARRGVVKVANPVVVYIDQLAVVISSKLDLGYDKRLDGWRRLTEVSILRVFVFDREYLLYSSHSY